MIFSIETSYCLVNSGPYDLILHDNISNTSQMTQWLLLDATITSPPYLLGNDWWASMLASVYHDDVIKWKHFPRHWPFARGIRQSPANSSHKGQWSGDVMSSLICCHNVSYEIKNYTNCDWTILSLWLNHFVQYVIIQVLELMQMHPKERLRRVILTASWFIAINVGQFVPENSLRFLWHILIFSWRDIVDL